MIKVLLAAFIIVASILSVQIYYTVSSQNEIIVYKTKCDSLQRTSDSLYYELIPTQTELNRYQVAYEIFARRNPEAASQYGDIISNETE
jgi:hypothetical protein